MHHTFRRLSHGIIRFLGGAIVWSGILLLCLGIQVAILEGILRLWGYGESTEFLQSKTIHGKHYYTPNRAFYQQFSSLPLDRIMNWDELDFVVPQESLPDTLRIVVLGSSAAFGLRSAPRMVHLMLEDAFPHVQWELINAACPGMNSHVMRSVATSCGPLNPDVFLVYMGNNEAIGPFGPTTVLGRSRFFWHPVIIQCLIWLNNLRLTQVARADYAMAGINLPPPDALTGMLPSMTGHFKALCFYKDNLESICAAAKEEGAKVVVCTLAANKRFRGVDNPAEPEFNGISINGIIREVAEKFEHTFLADTHQIISEHSENGLPGYEFFYDNVHFNFDGNYIIACEMTKRIVQALCSSAVGPLAQVRDPEKLTLLSRDECARRLAWTEAAERELLSWQLQSFQDDYTRSLTRKRFDSLQMKLGDTWREGLMRGFHEALTIRPEDLYLRYAYFRHCIETRSLTEAKIQAEALIQRHEAARCALRAAGQLASLFNQQEKAIAAYRNCLMYYPDDPESLRNLGELLFAKGCFSEAQEYFSRFLRSNPSDAFLWCRIGQIQSAQGKKKAAEKTFKTIIKEDSKHPLAYRLLDELMAEMVSVSVRAEFWDRMMQEYSTVAEPYVRRAQLYLQEGLPKEALGLLYQAEQFSPDDPVVLSMLGEAAVACGKWQDAKQVLYKVIQMYPQDGKCRLLLIRSLLELEEFSSAQQEIEKARLLGIPVPPELLSRLDDTTK